MTRVHSVVAWIGWMSCLWRLSCLLTTVGSSLQPLFDGCHGRKYFHKLTFKVLGVGVGGRVMQLNPTTRPRLHAFKSISKVRHWYVESQWPPCWFLCNQAVPDWWKHNDTWSVFPFVQPAPWFVPDQSLTLIQNNQQRLLFCFFLSQTYQLTCAFIMEIVSLDRDEWIFSLFDCAC